MAQIQQVLRRLPAREHIVVIHIDGLVHIPACLSYEHIQQSLFIEIIQNRVLLPGVEHDKSLCQAGSCHGLYGLEDLILILSRNHGIDVLLLVAILADSPYHLQIEGILVSLPLRRGQNDSHGAGILGGQAAGLKIRFIAQLRHGLPDLLLGLAADRGMVLARTAYG